MAKLAGSKKITLAEMSQEINLKRYVGRDVTDDEKRMFLDLAVEYINNRTLDGKEVGNSKNFAAYTQEYADLKGVTRSNVDLFQDGDMLGALDGETLNGNKVRLEVEGSTQIKKGFNHHTGDTVPERPWFGLTRSEVKSIASNLPERGESSRFTLAELQAALEGVQVEQTE